MNTPTTKGAWTADDVYEVIETIDTYTHDQWVFSVSEADRAMVSIEVFHVTEPKPLDDQDHHLEMLAVVNEYARAHGVPDDEEEPTKDMLIDPDVAIALGGVLAKLGRIARRINKREEAQ